MASRQAQAVLRKGGLVGWFTGEIPRDSTAWSLRTSYPPGAPFSLAASSASERRHPKRLAWLRVTDRTSGRPLRLLWPSRR
jgi:hypothetical protein